MGKVFFQASDGVHGRELWSSDGTAAGTVMVKELNTGTTSSSAPASSDPVRECGTNSCRRGAQEHTCRRAHEHHTRTSTRAPRASVSSA